VLFKVSFSLFSQGEMVASFILKRLPFSEYKEDKLEWTEERVFISKAIFTGIV
jgi:hypothetical protein